MRVAAVVKDHLWMHQRSIADFAQEMGWSKATASRWFRGEALTADHLAQVIRWLLAEAPNG